MTAPPCWSCATPGPGIPAAELPHLFERFHRVEGARGRSIEGSGIGLALVQELVRLHGGTIAVESTVGQGGTFTVRLPFGTGICRPTGCRRKRASGSRRGCAPRPMCRRR